MVCIAGTVERASTWQNKIESHIMGSPKIDLKVRQLSRDGVKQNGSTDVHNNCQWNQLASLSYQKQTFLYFHEYIMGIDARWFANNKDAD